MKVNPVHGLKLHIRCDDLNTYVHNYIDKKHKDNIFMPIKVEIDEFDRGIDITLVPISPTEPSMRRYIFDLNKLPKENTK